MSGKKTFSPFYIQIVSILSLVGLWGVVAVIAQSELLPTPFSVFIRIFEEAQSGELFTHALATLGRVSAAFILAMCIGSFVGLVMGLKKDVDRFFDPWLLFLLNLPALVVIILCYLWIGLGEVAAVLAVAINKIPNVAVTLREGAKALDKGLMEMGQTYRVSRSVVIRDIVLPQLTPFFAAAARSGLALIWKIVLVVELLGRSNGVGFQLHLFFQLFDVTGILAYSVAFIVVIWTIEQGIIRPWQRHANRWRTS